MLKAEAVPPIPELTAEVAQAAFPKGNRYMRLRETFGEVFQDDLYGLLTLAARSVVEIVPSR